MDLRRRVGMKKDRWILDKKVENRASVGTGTGWVLFSPRRSGASRSRRFFVFCFILVGFFNMK